MVGEWKKPRKPQFAKRKPIMSLTALDSVLVNISPKIACAVYREVLPNFGEMLRSRSDSDMKNLISRLNKITNNSGANIIAIAMWPDDEMPENLAHLAAEIVANCAAIDRVEPSNA